MQQNQNPNQDPNNPNPNNPNMNPPPGDPNNPNTPPADMTTQDMLAAISEQMGGMPSGREGVEFTDNEKQLADGQFEIQVRFAFEDMQREVKAAIPDVSDTQAFSIGVGMMQGDISKVIDAVKDALKLEAEMDEKGETQTNLHVEGGESGKENNERMGGLAGILQGINEKYAGGTS